MQSFTFVHSADIHLDSPLRGLSGMEGDAIDIIRSAPRKAFKALVDRTIQEEAKFLVIAGDLYDVDWKDYQTGLYFVQQMGRLREAGIEAFLIYGNHDAKSRITRQLSLPPNVKVFSAPKAETHRIDGLDVALHGQSFRDREVKENLARGYPNPVPGVLNIGVLHTSLAGAEGHEPYAPCELGDLTNKGYDYWALGHVHKPSVLHEFPFVVYSGNLQGRHIRETGPKGAMLVRVDEGEIADVKAFHVDQVRWAQIEVSAADCETQQDVVDRIHDGIERAESEQAEGRLLACRVRISGSTPAHRHVVGDRVRLLAEARAVAQGLGDARAWVERLVLETEPVRPAGAELNWRESLGDFTIAGADQDQEFVEEIRSDLAKLISKLPQEVREDADDALLRAAVDSDYRSVIELAGLYAMERLLREEA